MKKYLLIPLGIAVIALSIVAYAAAISGAQTRGEQVSAQKQVLVDGDMEVPAIIVPNSLVDSDMENSGTSDWVGVSSAVLSKETSSPHGGAQVLRVVEDTGQGSARPAVTPVTSGKTYLIEGYARSDGTRQVLISQSMIGDVWKGNTDTDWQFFSIIYDSTTGLIYFGINTSGAPGGYGEFDDITVVEIIDAGTDAWSVINSAAISKQPGAVEDGAQILRVTHNGIANPAAQQVVLTDGETYRFTGWARGDGTAYPRLRIGSGTVFWTGTTSTDWQYFDVVQVEDGADSISLQGIASAAGYVEFDDVMVTEYIAPQTNAEKGLLVDGDMENGGVVDWTVGSGAVLSKQNGAKEDGKQIFRITILTSDNYSTAGQTVMTNGEVHRLTGWARGDGVNGKPAALGGTAYIVWMGTTSTEWQWFDVVFTATADLFRLGSYGDNATEDYVEYDDIVITEYTAPSTNDTKQLLSDGDMEASGTSDWTPGNSAILTKEEGAVEDGAQIFRVTYNAVASPFAYQAIFTEGKTYHITGWARGSGAGGSRPILYRAGAQTIWVGTNSATWQRIDVVFTSNGANGNFFLTTDTSTGTTYTEWDDIVVTEQ